MEYNRLALSGIHQAAKRKLGMKYAKAQKWVLFLLYYYWRKKWDAENKIYHEKLRVSHARHAHRAAFACSATVPAAQPAACVSDVQHCPPAPAASPAREAAGGKG